MRFSFLSRIPLARKSKGTVQQPLVISHQKVSIFVRLASRLLFSFTIDGRAPTDDYSAFNDVWDKPDGGMHKYLHRFLTSPDATFQHIAVWTIVQLLESGGQLPNFRF